MSQLALDKNLIDFFNKNPNQLYRSRPLAREMGIHNNEYGRFKHRVKALADEGVIARHKGGRYGKAFKIENIEGILRMTGQGYGFVDREDGGDSVFINKRNVRDAIHEDRVVVEIYAQEPGRSPEGRVVSVKQRAREKLVGLFKTAGHYAYIIPDDKRIADEIFIPDDARGDGVPGNKVQVRITKWGDARQNPEGEIIANIGTPGQGDTDILSIIHEFNLPLKFPELVEEEASAWPEVISDSMIESREDFRGRPVITIDPDDAKDYDDAIDIERRGNTWRVGVHIADVSAFVPIGSATDKEALARGNSVYLPDRALPMLPEALSSRLCSLVPNEDRLAMSVIINLEEDGRVIDASFHETVIRSRHRLTYADVQDFFDGRGNHGFSEEMQQMLVDLRTVSVLLKERWQASGTIDFDAPEAKIVLNDDGSVAELGVRARLESHRLVEAFMLLANRVVPEGVNRLRQSTEKKLPLIYRVHEQPGGDKLNNFVNFTRAMGHKFDPGKKVTPKRFQKFLAEIKGSPYETVIEDQALRTMMKAQYDTQNIGHFGLAFKHYVHFTSPIRRYPDLVVHRLLKAYLNDENTPRQIRTLNEISRSSTQNEIKAERAEREAVKLMQLRYMTRHLGDEFNGIVSGVTSFGLFVEIPENLVEGLVRMSDLKDDYYEFDEVRLKLVGRGAGKSYRLGQQLKVKVARVDLTLRRMDFLIVE
ncbi:ribonuclease R [bacterium]|nr:ribonuclease R [bacterium]